MRLSHPYDTLNVSKMRKKKKYVGGAYGIGEVLCYSELNMCVCLCTVYI